MAPPFGDKLFDAGEFVGADFARGEQVAHHVRQAALEQTVEDVFRHPSTDLLLGNRGSVDEGASVGAVSHQAAWLHFAEHGGDGGIGEARLASEVGVDLGDGGFAAGPEDLHDLELQIAEAMDGGWRHTV